MVMVGMMGVVSDILVLQTTLPSHQRSAVEQDVINLKSNTTTLKNKEWYQAKKYVNTDFYMAISSTFINLKDITLFI